MISPPRILIYGQDAALLTTRRLVLTHSGLDVTAVLDLRDFAGHVASGSYALFLLCHSLSPEHCERALELTHRLHPGTKNLILSGALSSRSGGPGDATLSAFVDPRTLIHAVHELSGRRTAEVEGSLEMSLAQYGDREVSRPAESS